MNDVEYAYLKRKVQLLLKIDIDAYKSRQMRRRLEAFVARYSDSPVHFAKSLESDEGALSRLKDMLTINVSEFFRDPQQYQYLTASLLPELARRGGRIRLWSAGCSHGQEPYSLAICLAQASPLSQARILATDLDPSALRRAKAGGPYLPEELRNVSSLDLARHFEPSDEGYMVGERLRACVEFREHNLLSEPLEGPFDLIACRNVIIYFSAESRSKVIDTFRHALRPHGVLFVGGSEALLGQEAAKFERLYGNFYRRAADVSERPAPRPLESRIA